MCSIEAFRNSEYEKLMEALGLTDVIPDEEVDDTDYLDTRSFGKQDGDYQYTLSSTQN